MNKLGFAVLALAVSACSSSSSGTGAAGHRLLLDVTLTPKDGELAFLTPSNTVVKYPVESIVGKPYLIATFHAGFSPGNDPPVDHQWGTVPPGLAVHYATPASYSDGAYDVVFVVYSSTPITPSIESGPAQSAPAAKGGDLASFTLDSSAVRPGDPKNAIGTIRLNVESADAEVALENRVPQDPTNAQQTTAAFANTILTIP